MNLKSENKVPYLFFSKQCEKKGQKTLIYVKLSLIQNHYQV
jgi:hypothetical protein